MVPTTRPLREEMLQRGLLTELGWDASERSLLTAVTEGPVNCASIEGRAATERFVN